MRLLLIDDDARVRDSLATLLLVHGYDVVTAEGGEIGLLAFCRAATDGAPFDVVISALARPTVDCVKVLDRIRSVAPQTLTLQVTRRACAV